MTTEDTFHNAVRYVQEGPPIKNITQEMKLKFYGLYKQSTEGKCKEKAPSRIKLIQRAKWDAWNNLGNISKEEAMKKYIDQLESLVPDWKDYEPTKSKL